MKNVVLIFILSVLLFSANFVLAQKDSLIMVNGDVIVGEFKDMDRGILAISTDYSDSDFKIEWEGIREIYSVSRFLITSSDGSRYNGTIRTSKNGKVLIDDEDTGNVEKKFTDVVFLKSIENDFWSRFYAAVDVGYSFTKANNLKSFNSRSTLGYLADRWQAETTYNALESTQDDIEPIRRKDGGVSYRQYLQKDWYLPVDLTFLSNTEQQIKLRTNAKVGIGNYILHTNASYWGFAAGCSYMYESFSGDNPVRSSMEIYLGTELNLYDVGDFSVLTKVIGYYGLTEADRWRTDLVFDTRYELPFDFYVKLGFSLNYDSQPVEGTPAADYVFSTGLGWEW
jgi:hypothetical protein